MNGSVEITTPLSDDVVKSLRSGAQVTLSGTIYSARDAAHKKLLELILSGKPLPFDLRGSVIFYLGPSPAPPGRIIGSAGPTTSGRMDSFVRVLMERGLKGMIGKGKRSPEVIGLLKEFVGVYFGATGGTGALLARSVKESNLLAFPELGPEAILRLRVEALPLIVIDDCYGNDLYSESVARWERG